MKLSRFVLIIIVICCSIHFGNAQTQKILRVNFLNPAISYELPTGKNTSLDASLGFGYNYSYPDLTSASTEGVQYLFAMFGDIQSRYYYNLSKREKNGKTTDQNNGNFIAARLLYTGPDISQISSFDRFNNNSFAIGPTWGLQRTYGKRFNLLFSAGPIYYFDLKGNGNIFPLNLELNLGVNLN
ncbi:MAG: DUF3575 domain-containing protein [Mongoliibacter sp.]|uniref:DUF3575 domain-containing protein n=1 Tax=Mongoliibacter sp. TaxID=2022438 RepID=UPI0012F03E2C|nr:DUF3575 domain-containing protein [Mongoliibacter sp.]TVP53275.1 MAG: DUF3575 domain-containing protein [Mongoliibacter sp.]